MSDLNTESLETALGNAFAPAEQPKAKEAPAPEPRPSFMQQTSFADPPPPGDDDIPF